MTTLTLTLTSLSLVILAAHFLRAGFLFLASALICLALLQIMRRAWLRPVLVVACLAGSLILGQSTIEMVHFRLATGQEWTRLVAIMGAVMALGVAAAALLSRKAAARFFHKNPRAAHLQAGTFLLTAALASLAKLKSPLPVFLADRFSPGSGWIEIFFLCLYATAVAGAMRDPARSPKARGLIWSFFSLLFFGQLVLGLAGIDQMLMTGRLHLPVPALILAGPIYRGHGFFMPILFGVSLLLLGPAWCSHLCYIGAWDDRLSHLRGKKPRRAGPVLTRFLAWGRPATLVLALGLALGFRALGVAWLPATLAAAAFGLGGVAVMVLASRRLGRMVHCTAYCPMGLVANVLGKINPWRIGFGPACDGCGRCAKACRYGALEPRHIARARPGLSCTLCGDCVGACPNSNLGYRFPGLSPRAARHAFLVMAVSLHALFLGVARI